MRRFLLLLLVSCASARATPELVTAPQAGLLEARPPLELVESWPLETTLDHKDIPDAKDVWLSMVNGASARLDFAEFYASDDPKARSPLTAIVEAIEAAAARGVKVRWLGEEKFYKTYPELMDRFAKKGIEVRRLDTKKSMGGILHAKYFIADDTAYLGSQNFDWRSLIHIQELGLRTSIPEVVTTLRAIYDSDWALAAGETHKSDLKVTFPVHTKLGEVSFVASPKGYLPDESLWELPKLVSLIDGAKKSVRVQLLTYGTRGKFYELQDALKRAAARGVRVELMVSNWSQRGSTIGNLKKLQAPPDLTIKLLTIPQWSGGYVPFARVAHAKYMVVDNTRAWIGTSNWERDYFYQSRNVGLIIEGGPIPERLGGVFSDNWSGAYVETVDPKKYYETPKIGEP